MNFNKFQKISISFLVILFLFSLFSFLFSLPNISFAAESSPKINLTYPWSEEKSPTGLVSRFYQIALGLAGAAALGVLIYGAILWTLSGAVTSKQDALEWIKGAIWGVVLLLGAYLILWTINPRLVEIGKTQEELEGAIKKVKAPEPEKEVKPIPGILRSIPEIVQSLDPKIYSADPSVKEQQEKANLDCGYNCKAIPFSVPMKPGICQGYRCSADASVVESLNKLVENTFIEGAPRPINWQVTEAWPPDVRHDDINHYKGKAIDIVLTAEVTQAKVDALIKAAEKAGFKVLNEYPEFGGKKTNTALGKGHLHLYKL